MWLYKGVGRLEPTPFIFNVPRGTLKNYFERYDKMKNIIYDRNCDDYYIELIHLLTEKDLYMNLLDKKKLDNKVIDLVKLLRKIKYDNNDGVYL